MKGFIEVTIEGQKYCVNVSYIIRFNKVPSNKTVLYLRGNCSFSVLAVNESYDEIRARITKAVQE